MARSCLIVGALAGLFAFLPPLRALAQASASEKASAEALFDAAVQDMKAGHYTDACPKFENSQRIDPGVGTLLYLGDCYERVGRTASAWATFREAASGAEASGQVKRAKIAKDRAAKLEPTLSYLTIEVAEATRALPGLRIRRDGADGGLGIIGAAVPADPGLTKIEVTAPDHEAFSVSVRVQAQARQTVLIPTLAAVEPSARAAEPPLANPPPAVATPATTAPPSTPPQQEAPPPAAEPSSGTAQRVVGLALGGVGVVGIGLGSYFGLSAIGHEKKADRACTSTQCPEQAGYDQSQSAGNQAVLSNVTFGVGGGLIALGAILYLTAPTPPATGVSVTPLVAPGFAGLRVGGRL